MTKISLKWNLDSLFPGGSQSSALSAALQHLKQQIQHFNHKLKRLSDIKTGLLHFESLEARCQDLLYFIECLLSQNVKEGKIFRDGLMTLKQTCARLGISFMGYLKSWFARQSVDLASIVRKRYGMAVPA